MILYYWNTAKCNYITGPQLNVITLLEQLKERIYVHYIHYIQTATCRGKGKESLTE